MPEESLATSKEIYLRKSLAEEISTFEEKRILHKKRAFVFKIAGTAFSTITTVLLGLQGLESQALLVKNLALILSACVTIISAWDAFFNHRELWVRYTVTSRRLRDVMSDLDYLLAGENHAASDAKLDELYSRFRAILDDTNSSWLKLRQEHGTKAS